MLSSSEQRSEQKKNGSIAELSHFILCVFRYFRQFAIQKIFPPSFQFFTSPNFFYEPFASTDQWSGRP